MRPVESEIDMTAYLQRLGSLPTFNIHEVTDKGTKPWYEVVPANVVAELMIHETDLSRDVTAVAAQIFHWGRLEAQAKRAWEVQERMYRQWREGIILKLVTPPRDEEEAKKWKKPPEHVLEAHYRADKNYPTWQSRLEQAEETYNCAHAVREAFLAKRDMLKVAVVRAPIDSAPRLAV